VEFTQWTHEDTLRAAAFKGLRDDKGAREVVREPRAPAPSPSESPG
jgi:bifunctional non-homologous end joining protein LigD